MLLVDLNIFNVKVDYCLLYMTGICDHEAFVNAASAREDLRWRKIFPSHSIGIPVFRWFRALLGVFPNFDTVSCLVFRSRQISTQCGDSVHYPIFKILCNPDISTNNFNPTATGEEPSLHGPKLGDRRPWKYAR